MSQNSQNLITDLPLHGRRLIEASAGTGKTYTLVGLYLRLVLGLGAPVRLPPEILVLTFTKAATAELRERIRSRLIEAAAAFRLGHSNDALLAWLLDQFGPTQHAAQAHRLEIAAGWMDEAAIHTIHGWCNTVLRQHAFDSGALFDVEMAASDPQLKRHAAMDYWRQYWYVDQPWKIHLTRLARDFEAFEAWLRPVRDKEDELLHDGQAVLAISPADFALDLHRPQEQPEGQAVAEVLRQWAALEGEVRDCVLQALEENAFRADSTSRLVKDSKAGLPDLLDALDAWQPGQPFPEHLEWMTSEHFQTISKNNRAPQHAWLDALGEALPAWQARVNRLASGVLAHAREQINARHAIEKQRVGRMDFDDLISGLDTALARDEDGRLRQTLLDQHPVALIDEFQDTDPVQYRIFHRLWGEDGPEDPESKALILIGDPKQSIYGFRNADIHAYLRARSNTDKQYSLDRNFRSSTAMVEAVNLLFEAGHSRPGGAFAFGEPGQPSPIPFERVQAQGLNEVFELKGAAVPALTLMYQGPEGGALTLPMDAYRTAMAAETGERIAHLLQAAAAGQAGFRQSEHWRPLAAADVAVLVRDRREAAQLRRALRSRGIPSVFLSDQETVFDSAQARDLVLVLRALAQPSDPLLLRSALATALLQRSLKELDAPGQDDRRLDAELDRFHALHEQWQRQGVLAMLHALLMEYELPGRLLAQGEEGERALTNLRHLAELLQAEAQGREGEQALIQWLEEQIEGGHGGQADELRLRLESDDQRVRVVTLHAAKGLEYPLVFMPFACAYKKPKNQEPARYHEEEGYRLDLAPDEAARKAAEREQLQEEIRLFYVGATRARHACWMGMAPVLSGKGKAPSPLKKYPPGHLLKGLAQTDEEPPELRVLMDRLAGQAPEKIVVENCGQTESTWLQTRTDQALSSAREYTGRPRQPWWVASYSSLPLAEEGAAGPGESASESIAESITESITDSARQELLREEAAAQPALVAEDIPLHGVHAFPRGPQPGTFLHGLLEWAGQQGFARVVNAPEEFMELIEQRCRLRGWSHWTELVQRWMLDLIRLPMKTGSAEFALADLNPAACVPELSFWFEARSVQLPELDGIVSRHTLNGQSRPMLAEGRVNGMLRGFIDLVFEHEGRYWVLDYKSNHLGADASAYDEAPMAQAIAAQRYDLQYALYLLALHRLLKARLPDYDYDRHVGGAIYLFLRGHDNPTGGVFCHRPDAEMIHALDALFSDQPTPEAPPT